MRTAITLALTSLLLLAACGGEAASSATTDEAPPETITAPPPPAPEDGSYPQEAIDEFVGGCAVQAGQELCECAIDVVQTEVPYEEFIGMRGEMEATGSLPPDLLTVVIENCV